MIDCVGKELHIKDIVVVNYISNGFSRLERGTVTKIVPHPKYTFLDKASIKLAKSHGELKSVEAYEGSIAKLCQY